jgi:nucleoid-associated protein YgaU
MDKDMLPEEDRIPGKGMRDKPRPPQKPKPKPAPEPEFIAEHTVVSGDSLSKIAAQYYGSGTQDKWMLIYEANKEIIGDNPSLIHPGQVFKIPPLEEE